MTRARTALVMAAAALLGAAAPGERVVRLGETAPLSVNGVSARLRVDPGALGMMLLSPDLAARAKVGNGGLLGFGFKGHIGPTAVSGRTVIAHVGLNGQSEARRRIVWAARPYAAGVDAVIGPAGLDERVVRFVLRAPAAVERTAVLAMAPNGGMFADWDFLTARMTLGGEPVGVRFAPFNRRTLANATLARRLADVLGGRLTGPATDELIAFGVERPVRTMTLARPLAVGPVALATLGVRVADTGSVAGLPEATDDPSEAADPDEVVVTAKSKRKARPAGLTLGADALARCSSIVFDRPAKQIRLSCA